MRPAALSQLRPGTMSWAQPRALISVRGLTALATAVTGLVHANLYVYGGYRVIHIVGPGFLLLSSTAFAIAVLMLIGGPPVLRLGAAAVAIGALGGFVTSRTVGVFGFTERGLQPAPQALISLISELGTIALLVSWEVIARRTRGTAPVPADSGQPIRALGRRIQRAIPPHRLP